MEGLQCFRFGVEKMPKWFTDKVGTKEVQLRRTDDGVLCCKFKDSHGNEKLMLYGEAITNDMLYS